MKRLICIAAAGLAVLAAPSAWAQDPVNYASLFGFSTVDGLVDCTGQFWAGGRRDALVFCEGRNGRGATAEAVCDLDGCRQQSSTRLRNGGGPWNPTNTLPEGAELGGGDRSFHCDVGARIVTCAGPRGFFTVSGDGVFHVESR